MEINLNINKIRNIFKIDKEDIIKYLDFIAATFILMTYAILIIFLPNVLNKKIETTLVFGVPLVFNIHFGLIIMIIILLLSSYVIHLQKELKKLNGGDKK